MDRIVVNISNRQRIFEVVAVVLTGCLKIVFVDIFPLKFWYILGALVFWIYYLLKSRVKNPEILKYWGFTRINFRKTISAIFPFALASILVFIGYGIWQKTMVLNWHIIPVLLLYPLWGLIQQYLIIALIAGNLRSLDSKGSKRSFIILITAFLFSIVHYPSYYLILATFLLAIFYTILYLKYWNLWALGIFHGWLGGLFYFFVLGRDPWIEVFSTF